MFEIILLQRRQVAMNAVPGSHVLVLPHGRRRNRHAAEPHREDEWTGEGRQEASAAEATTVWGNIRF